MCRLFGFRSVIPSQVHSSLVAAENALGTQSNQHPDGWGVAFYIDGAPHVTRSPQTALGDQLFHRLSGVVASETVLAHVRRATQGANTVLNCHPFQYGRWVFAHNGDIPDFPKYRDRIEAEIAPRLRRFILGDTDSERLFYIFLTRLEGYGPLNRRHSLEDVVNSMRQTVKIVKELWQGSSDGKPLLLTMMATDGDSLIGHQGGKELFLSTYKKKCPDRERCSSLSAECEAPSTTGFVNHFILSSEPLQGHNVWLELAEGEIAGVDGRMKTLRALGNHSILPVAS
ncbi:MAG TPA: class II glutamine amidotransferase [Polyangiaceae bacterium]|nr:class II glutamine amidotransferase [Polyangiaceae bacterium]